ncbi:response regulator transcription factor [Anaerotalea alkaliphila]|uniref:Stage 0 sporulation protein A homolog n=1 Tax=Anaerotalea alkaliphila TaxID=2662126 RepID=A0A7X5HU58_9FIRM|nr:response regulator transcription factor [Anaerotalea alkaliphila]NDL66699.1 response regulator transcription factor [Anaerotalea alkaliphila]
MIKVMVVDDQVLLRKTLLFMLEQDEGISVVDGGGDGLEAVRNCKLHWPDVVLMDLRMPHMDGREAMRQIKELYPSIKVLVLTTFEDKESILESLDRGADGYIVKDIKPEELVLAVRGAYHGLKIFHGHVLETLRYELHQLGSRQESGEGMVERLGITPLEVQMIGMIVDGKSNKEIADALGFTEGTIKNKVSKLLGKLDLKDRMQIAVFAINHDLF